MQKPDTQSHHIEDTAIVNLTEILESKLDQVKIRVVKEIAKNIFETGLSTDDCCLLSRITPKMLSEWIEDVPEIETYLNIKKISYKQKLLKVLTDHATTAKDVKVANMLLETQFPQEYNQSIQKEIHKQNAKDVRPTDALDKVFDFIRNASTGPVDPNNNHDRQQTDAKVDFSQMLNEVVGKQT